MLVMIMGYYTLYNRDLAIFHRWNQMIDLLNFIVEKYIERRKAKHSSYVYINIYIYINIEELLKPSQLPSSRVIFDINKVLPITIK